MYLKASLALMLATGLIAAGCGDDDDETTTTTTTTSGATGATGESGAGILPADFATSADAICKEGDEAIDDAVTAELGDATKEPTEAEQEQLFTAIVIPGIQQQVDALRALGEPEEGAEELSTFLDDAQSALDELETDPSVVAEGEDPFADVEEQASALGLTECAS